MIFDFLIWFIFCSPVTIIIWFPIHIYLNSFYSVSKITTVKIAVWLYTLLMLLVYKYIILWL